MKKNFNFAISVDRQDDETFRLIYDALVFPVAYADMEYLLTGFRRHADADVNVPFDHIDAKTKIGRCHMS